MARKSLDLENGGDKISVFTVLWNELLLCVEPWAMWRVKVHLKMYHGALHKKCL